MADNYWQPEDWQPGSDQFNPDDWSNYADDPYGGAGYDDGLYGANPNGDIPIGTDTGTQFGPKQQSGGNGGVGGNMNNAGNILQKLFGGGKQPGQNGADIASLLGAFSSGNKANRIDQGNFAQKYDQNMLAAQTGRNQTESDALKKLAQTSYIMGGGSKFKPPVISLNGKSYQTPDLGYGPQAPSEAQKQGASSLQGQLAARLAPGGTYTPQPLDSYAKAGTAENIGNYGALASGGIGALLNILGGNSSGNPSGASGAGGASGAQGPSGASQALGYTGTGLGLAKMAGAFGNSGQAAGAASGASGAAGAGGQGMSALGAIGRFGGPAVGAAAGIYGLSQNKGGMNNVMNGAGTGASIGTMILPGIGTGIGAGLGAAYGGLQNLFTTTQKEKDGRTVEGNFEKAMGGFQPMMNAVGSGYASHGHSSQEAQADVKAMLDAEKHGPEETQKMLQTVLSKMGRG